MSDDHAETPEEELRRLAFIDAIIDEDMSGEIGEAMDAARKRSANNAAIYDLLKGIVEEIEDNIAALAAKRTASGDIPPTTLSLPDEERLGTLSLRLSAMAYAMHCVAVQIWAGNDGPGVLVPKRDT